MPDYSELVVLPEWRDAIIRMAHAEIQVRRVWLFGSRIKGKRRPKPAPYPIPDLDIAVELDLEVPGRWLSNAALAARLATIPVAVHLQTTNAGKVDRPDDHERYVWPAVLDHGELIYDRDVD